MGVGTRNPILRLLANLLPQALIDEHDSVYASRVQRALAARKLSGAETETINALTSMFIHYQKGEFEKAGVDIDRAVEQGLLRPSGNNKHIYVPDAHLVTEIKRTMDLLGGRIAIYGVAPDGHRIYDIATEALKRGGYPTLHIIAKIPNKIVSHFTNAVPADEYVQQHPESLDMLLDHVVDVARFLDGAITPSVTAVYDTREKLAHSLGTLTPAGNAALNAVDEYVRRNAASSFVDRSIPNHFVIDPEQPLERESLKARVIPADFETLSQRTTHGHNLADILYKTTTPLSPEQRERITHRFEREFASNDLPFEVFLRTLRLTKSHPQYQLFGAAADQFNLFGYQATPSFDGITAAWNACSAAIIARSNQ